MTFPGPRHDRDWFDDPEPSPVRGMVIGFLLGLAAWGLLWAAWGLL